MPASCASGGSLDSRASSTANSGGLTTSESSLAVRCRPTSVRPACSTMWSAIRLLLVAVFAVADPDRVPDAEPLRGLHLPPVQVGAVRGAHVLEVHDAGAVEDA